MKEPRNHLPRDLKALRYLDALNAGDLEAVSALWEEASHDPELERMLAELDGACLGRSRATRARSPNGSEALPADAEPAAAGRVWVGAVVALAAACLLAILAWPWRDTKNPVSSSPMNRDPRIRSHPDRRTSPTSVTPLRQYRRDLEEAEMPTFNWPLEKSVIRLDSSRPARLRERKPTPVTLFVRTFFYVRYCSCCAHCVWQ